MAKKFDLGDALAGVLKVSESDTETLEQIDINLIDGDDRNFYTLDGIDDLAANIQMIGLQQPIRIRPNPDMPGRYRIVSGHRRRAALWTLYEEAPERWGKVPCIIEHDAVSPAMEELRLIYANADTRKLSDADLAKQAERVQELLYQLKEEGTEFPGRMRDHVAAACKVSATKLATLKVIREKLIPAALKSFDAGTLATETAYLIAQLPMEVQEKVWAAVKAPSISDIRRIQRVVAAGMLYDTCLTCPDGKACIHQNAFIRHDTEEYEFCGGSKCCVDCNQALRDWYPCKRACSKAKAARSEKIKKEKEKQAKADAAAKAKVLKALRTPAARLVKAIDAAGLRNNVKINFGYRSFSVEEIRLAAAGEWNPDMHVSEDLFKFAWIDTLKDAVKVLRCSADYLLGLTDDLAPSAAPAQTADASPDTPQFCTEGRPSRSGKYYCMVSDQGEVWYPVLYWLVYADGWTFDNGEVFPYAVAGWYLLPDDEDAGGDSED